MSRKPALLCVIVLFSCLFIPVSATKEGFYCDVFQDAGTRIKGLDIKLNCEYINYTQEHLRTNDTAFQTSIMVASKDDANGYLLYPDGAPRYQMIYFHGGVMRHSTDLGEQGRKVVRMFYYNGGSGFGSCAGSYMLCSSGADYFKIWPGRMDGPNIGNNTRIDKIINPGSPLIGYNGFKAGDIVKDVRHNNGGSVDTVKAPEGTQFCAMHNGSTLKGYCDVWTWKDNDTTGRVLGITGHPEGVNKEDQIKYFTAIMLYLSDGLGKPRIKNTLRNNRTIAMDKKWEDNTPQYTAIGDKQYHHFLLGCSGATDVKIRVAGREGFDFHLFVAKDTFAFVNKAGYSDTAPGANKTISIPALGPGKWYVGVKLNTTVTADATVKDFPKYSGKLEVLNGIPYTITATWSGTQIVADNSSRTRQSFIHSGG